jgi:hypothetical protein
MIVESPCDFVILGLGLGCRVLASNNSKPRHCKCPNAQ